MTVFNSKHQGLQRLIIKWLPAILILAVLFFVPPVAIAVIVAYFTAPILQAIRSIVKLPLTLATLIVMCLIFLLVGAFTFMALHGLLDTLPAVERQISPFTGNTDIIAKTFTFLENNIVQYGHALLEYTVTKISAFFQQMFSLFIFLVAYFFALRESGKNRFWFLIYFPKVIRTSTKDMITKSSMLIGTFLSVEFRLFLLTFLVLTVGFFFLRFESPIGTAFLISLADSLPLLGIGIFLLPMSAFFLYTGNKLIGISLIFLYFFTMTTRQMAESYMWASTFQVKPIHAFYITVCSFYLFGIPGILLTPFLLFAAIKVRRHSMFTSS
ncbi:AI-2E family transporter [Sporosarcina sp. ACRSM]|uniref:AI-2E family transporter n=1 Tax=Sporosarcina sp. ACRSM TaxID=2918216 RepID=UPI001EF43499|nr:AI-2E family transporter [Sporosarcina sp. ACRSM]MCG7335496.1 AI-2E family transporter [Sporosarcina sp. ACRSM]